VGGGEGIRGVQGPLLMKQKKGKFLLISLSYFHIAGKLPKGYMALEQIFVSARTIKRHHHHQRFFYLFMM
jgi:hypothetical protein